MSKYSRLLKQVEFPWNSNEYHNLVLGQVFIDEDEAIRGDHSIKLSNIKFRFKDAILATIKFLSTYPGRLEKLPGFILGLVEYVGKLKDYSTIVFSENERMIVEYAAVMFMDSGYRTWPSEEELRKRLPKQMTDEEFRRASDRLQTIGCFTFNNGNIEVIEEVVL